MSDRTLQQVENQRRELVVRAQAALSERLRERAALLAGRREVVQEERRAEAALSEARTGFAMARTVRELRCAATWTEASRRALEAHQVSLRRFERELALAGARVRECQQALRAAEVGRVSAERLLAKREREVSRRTSLRLEDEADDAFRARFRG